jgi:hypothetical protein
VAPSAPFALAVPRNERNSAPALDSRKKSDAASGEGSEGESVAFERDSGLADKAPFPPAEPFMKIGLRAEIASAMTELGIQTPTPIQIESAERMLRGESTIIVGRTGTLARVGKERERERGRDQEGRKKHG